MTPGPHLAAAVARAVGSACGWRRVLGGGYSLAERWTAELAAGGTVFVKGAIGEDTARGLRIERHVYETLGASFMPRLQGWDDDGERPVLVLEDLSAAEWRARGQDGWWTAARVGAVLEMLELVAKTPAPAGLRELESMRGTWAGWCVIADRPERFLSLGMCTARWLEDALPVLIEGERKARLGGDQLVHMDVRSDNMCFRDGRAVLVDWNWSSVGHAPFDVAAWLPSLHAEGGPVPDAIAPDSGAHAALLAGYFAKQAPEPPPEGAPRVREVQRAQLATALPWAVRALGLPPPDGPVGQSRV